MIAGIFHQGSGLGNQLFRYVATRVLAKDKGVNFCMLGGPFKGQSFMAIDLALGQPPQWFLDNAIYWNEKKVVEDGVDIRGYDPEINFVKDNTVIDGEFQDPRYFEHRMDEVNQWLKVEPLYMRPDLCVIGFRGGEYKLFSDLFLPQDWWNLQIRTMRMINPNMKFEVHTDDPETAKEFFPDFKIIHDIGINWRSVRYAKYAIIANSSFYILPRLLKHHEDVKAMTFAPKYWARHNTKTWALSQNYYKQFIYSHAENTYKTAPNLEAKGK